MEQGRVKTLPYGDWRMGGGCLMGVPTGAEEIKMGIATPVTSVTGSQ